MGSVGAVLKLIRPYTTLLAFLSIFIPVLSRTRNLIESATLAAPLLFVSMCTFLINDLDDVEKDRINHPERPLPRGEISPGFVVVLYYICLAGALFTVRFGVNDRQLIFLYFGLITLAVSYNYVVEYLPSIKAAYVAAVSTLPVLIVATLFPHERRLFCTAAAFFAFNWGRELRKDVLDRPGDTPSALHKVSSTLVARSAFALQAIALVLLTVQTDHVIDLVMSALIDVLSITAFVWWFYCDRRVGATTLMKAAMYFGLYFLMW